MFEKLSKPHIGFLIVVLLVGTLIALSCASERVYHYPISIFHEAYRMCAIIVLFAMALAFSFRSNSNWSQKLVGFSCIFLFWGILISAYHILIQKGIMSDFGICKMKILLPNNVSVERFYELIRLRESTSCSNLELTILGHSISEVYCVGFIFLFVYVSVCFQKKVDK